MADSATVHSITDRASRASVAAKRYERVLEGVEASPHNTGMSTSITREEVDAKLAANVAEVKAVASEMRAEMTTLRADNQAQFAELRAFMEVQAAKTEAAFSSLNAKIEGAEKSMATKVDGLATKVDGVEKGLEGKIDGIKSSITTMQWLLGIVAALVAIWISYIQLKQAEAPTPPAAIATPSATPKK